jgi:hypothetical protein
MAVTTLTLSPEVRDRLKLYGTAGMTYDDILVALMDQADEADFVREIRRRASELDSDKAWASLADA